MNAQVPCFIPQLRLGIFLSILICLFFEIGLPLQPVSIAHDAKAANHQNSQTWELPDGAFVRLGKGVMGGSDRAIAFSPDGKHLAVASGIGIWIYDVETAHELTLLNVGHATLIRSVAYSPDRSILASGSGDGTIQLWAVETGQHFSTSIRHRLGGRPSGAVDALAFSPDGTTLASASEEIKLWDVESRAHLATLKANKRKIFSVAFSPDGTILVSGAWDDTVKLWEVGTGQHISTLHGAGGWSLAYSPDGNTLALGQYDGTVKLTDVKSGRRVGRLRGYDDIVNTVVFSPDGTKLAVGARGGDQSSRGIVKLWRFPPKALDVLTQRSLSTFYTQSKGGIRVAFSPDSRILAVGSDDGVSLLDVETGEKIVTLEKSFSPAVAFSPDGRMLASRSADGTRLWDVSTRKIIMTSRQEVESSGAPVAFSPDSKMLAMGTSRGKIVLLDVKTERNIATRHGHGEAVSSVAFSPDGNILASGSRDGTALLWKVSELIDD